MSVRDNVSSLHKIAKAPGSTPPKNRSPTRLFRLCGTYLDCFQVPRAGLEPARLSTPPPQDGVSTNSTTWAWTLLYYHDTIASPEKNENPPILFTLKK